MTKVTKDVIWCASSKKDLSKFPDDVRDLSIYQFSSAPQSCGRGRQDRINLTMRRSPRVNQEVLPRATFLG